jgi:hypothetical protein
MSHQFLLNFSGYEDHLQGENSYKAIFLCSVIVYVHMLNKIKMNS